MMRLTNKTVIVTGGGSGIGRAIAIAMARESAKVFVIGRTKAKLEETVEIIISEGKTCRALLADVANAEEVKSAVEEVIEREGRIDVLVNNAAILTKPSSIEETTEEQWDALINVNLKGPFLCCREVAPHMKAQRSGKIINIGSTGAFFAFTPVLPYAASKGGLLSFSKVLATEMAPYGVTVNVISPGPIGAGMGQSMVQDETKRAIAKRIPMGRVGKPEEVASLACYLSSDEASYISGESIIVAGGLPGIPFD